MIFHRVLEHAVKWGLLARNPADAVSPPKIRHVEMKILQPSDIEFVLSETKKHRTMRYFSQPL
jgi:hypothetical protein